jgi:predicted dehydrogenase
MDNIRLGFVGAGFMGQKAHLDSFVTIPDCEIVALAEGRSQTAQLVASRYGIPRVYPNHRAMLEAETLDAVIAILPYRLHHAVVPDLLRAGVHVLTEKPICVGVDTARSIAQLAQDQGVIYYVGYMKRSLPATQAALQTIQQWKASGAAGALKYLRASMPPGDWIFGMEPPLSAGDPPAGYDSQAPEPLPPEFPDAAGRLYDSFINYYIHQVNLIRHLLGEDYHVQYADSAGTVLAGQSDSGVTVVLEMQGYGQKHDWEESYRVVFEQGKIDLSLPAPLARQAPGSLTVFLGADAQLTSRPSLPPAGSFLEQARHFIRCVRGQDAPRVTPWDAVKDLEVAAEYTRLRMGT